MAEPQIEALRIAAKGALRDLGYNHRTRRAADRVEAYIEALEVELYLAQAPKLEGSSDAPV